jgi:hypothetical protein
VRFRRRSGDQEPADPVEPDEADTTLAEAVAGARANGPWDADEVDLDPADPTKVDLGSLVLTGQPGLELRVQVDEASGGVQAALLAGPEGAVELIAFAAPRNGSIWDDMRKSIAAEAARHGGTATEVEGPYGTELAVVVSGVDEKGQAVTQPSRMVGIEGPRWLLRATYLGRPAVQPDPDGDLERAVRDVVVRRGVQAMAPGDLLPLALPHGPAQPPAGSPG